MPYYLGCTTIHVNKIFTVQSSINFRFSQINGTTESHTLIKAQQTRIIQSIKGAFSPLFFSDQK